jgi:hypothetical protein
MRRRSMGQLCAGVVFLVRGVWRLLYCSGANVKLLPSSCGLRACSHDIVGFPFSRFVSCNQRTYAVVTIAMRGIKGCCYSRLRMSEEIPIGAFFLHS